MGAVAPLIATLSVSLFLPSSLRSCLPSSSSKTTEIGRWNRLILLTRAPLLSPISPLPLMPTGGGGVVGRLLKSTFPGLVAGLFAPFLALTFASFPVARREKSDSDGVGRGVNASAPGPGIAILLALGSYNELGASVMKSGPGGIAFSRAGCREAFSA